MDAVQAFETVAKAAKSSAEVAGKAGKSYFCAIRQAYRDALKPSGDPESDYYASRLGRAEEGGEAWEPALEHHCDCGLSDDMEDLDTHSSTCTIWDDPTCYFCGEVTTNVVNTDDGDTEFVCEQCADDELPPADDAPIDPSFTSPQK
jgi:hypothetical protein